MYCQNKIKHCRSRYFFQMGMKMKNKNILMRIFNYRHLSNSTVRKAFVLLGCLILLGCTPELTPDTMTGIESFPRQRISINEGWRFHKYLLKCPPARPDLEQQGAQRWEFLLVGLVN